MKEIIDASELLEFAESLTENSKQLKNMEKKMLREQGTKLRRKTAQRARATVRKAAVNRKKYQRVAGQYHKSIKRGKIYEENGLVKIRVYSNDPIAHLIEDGWTPVLRNKKKGQKQTGKKVFEKSMEAFAPEFETAAADLVSEVIDDI